MNIFSRSLMGFVLCISLMPSLAWAEQVSGRITVSGRGEVGVVPDIAQISIGVEHLAPTASAAMAAMRQGMVSVFAELEAAGIAATDMRTGTLQLNRRYDNRGNQARPKLIGFEARNTVTITVRDIDILGAVLDVVVENGANELHGLQFDVTNRRPHLQEARRLAVADARAAADVLADAAGVELGPLIKMSEGGDRMRAPVAMFDMAMTREASTPVAAGEMSVQTQVEMIYEIAQ